MRGVESSLISGRSNVLQYDVDLWTYSSKGVEYVGALSALPKEWLSQ